VAGLVAARQHHFACAILAEHRLENALRVGLVSVRAQECGGSAGEPFEPAAPIEIGRKRKWSCHCRLVSKIAPGRKPRA
jgi:hypothetical protein